MTITNSPLGPTRVDPGYSSEIVHGRETAYMLGTRSEIRLRNVLRELGETVYLQDLDLPQMTFAIAMHSVWIANKPLALAAVRILAGDDRYHVRADLAAWVPEPMPDVFERLAHDPSLSVRQAIAKNAHTPALLLMRLADDREEIVRYAAAHNVKTPYTTLVWLARVDPDGVDQDPSVHVRQRARATLGGRP